MPPQQPGPGGIPDFDPTQDIPDFDPAVDIPDFDPAIDAAPAAKKFRTVEVRPGQFMSVPEGETPEQALRRIQHQPRMVGGVPEIFERMRQELSTKAATSPNIPDWLRPQAAIASSYVLEIPRFFAEAFSEPEGILTPGVVKSFGRFRGPPKPTPRKTPIALPPGRDPYIAGPAGGSGQVVRESEIIPELRTQAEARLVADPTTMTPGMEPPPVFTDLDELREAERLRNVFYTGLEQQGGTALDLGDDAERYLRGRELGSEQVSRAGESRPVTVTRGLEEPRQFPGGAEPLPYPLNVVPESVRPRSAQEVNRALAPRSMQEQTAFDPNVPPLESGTVPVPKTPPEPEIPVSQGSYGTRGGTAAIAPGEKTLPSATKRLKTQAAKNSGLNLTDTVVSSAPPELQVPLTKLIIEEAKAPSPWRAIESTLQRIVPDLRTKVARWRQLSREGLARYAPAYREAVKGLSRTERQNIGGYVNGSIPITSPAVQDAVDMIRQIFSDLGDEAAGAGLRLFAGSKKWIPFQKHGPDYWPSKLSEDIPRESLVDRLMADNKKLTRAEATRIANEYMKTGELVLGAQRARVRTKLGEELNYRLDADAGLEHIQSMTDRIARHNVFGPLDLEGKGSEGIADLIEAIPSRADRDLVVRLMRRILAREEKSIPHLRRMLDGARKYSSITKLFNFVFTNPMVGQPPTALHAIKYPIASLKEVAKLLSPQYRKQLVKSGIWENLNFSLAEELSKFGRYNIPGRFISKGIEVGEMFNRGIAGAIGKAVARGAHKTLRNNPTSKSARYELSELVLEDVDKLARQSELTEDQLNMAAGRLATKTQGLSVPENLPFDWSGPVTDYKTLAVQLTLIFKKMGYQVTRDVFASMNYKKVGPAAAATSAATWLVATQIAGELTGDTKMGIKGLWTGEDEIANRGSFWLEGNGISPAMINAVADNVGMPPELIARMTDNAVQAFFLGLPADMILNAAYGPYGALASVAGPIYTEASKFMTEAVTGDVNAMLEQILSNIPGIGSYGAEALTEGEEVD